MLDGFYTSTESRHTEICTKSQALNRCIPQAHFNSLTLMSHLEEIWGSSMLNDTGSEEIINGTFIVNESKIAISL